jgi:nitroreductase
LNSQNSQQKEKQVEKRQIEQTLTPLDKEYLYDKDFYKKYNMGTEESLNKLGYESIIHTHTLEKGMEHFELRPFAVEKTRYIMSLIKRESKYENYENKFAFINGINSLREYKKIYEEHNWINKDEYKKVDEFLKNYSKVENQKAGAYILTKKELQNDYQIDYLKFVKSRHSTRNYKNEPIKLDDVKAAVEMAKYSASACNRQYIKLHFYPSGKMRDNVIHYALGKGGLYLDGVNTFIVTFDVNGLSGVGERNQGYFNAGLYSTNLVNAFHSLGIGTCFIQFANSVKDEDDLKRKNEIPEYERIAVILFAGYYDEKSIFAVSPRKNVSELLIEHK